MISSTSVWPPHRMPRRNQLLFRSLSIGCLLGLSACDLGPNYQRPDVPAPATFLGTDVHAAAAWPSADWWRGFNSPQLNTFIGQSRRANDDIAAAIARVREADAQARIAGAPLLPSVQGDFQAVHERTPTASGPSTFSQFSAALSASYELDFWGKNRAALNAALAVANASRFDHATVALTVMTSVATSYFQALELSDRLDIAQHSYDTAQTILNDLKLQQQAGTANALDVAQQATVAASLYAAIPPLKQQLRQTTNALAILVGNTPESLDISSGTLADLAQPQVVPGLPSELLVRRPDVAEAEAQLVAANANIALARAAFFPSIGLTANGGYESNALAGLFNPANAIFSAAAGMTQPIFEGGALRGQSEYAKARYTELLANYHKIVLSAFGNVEDALVALQQTAEQVQRQQQAVNIAQSAYEFARTQMQAGTISVLTLLNTESALFTAQDGLVQAKFFHLQALVNLFGALGGGWQQAQES